MGIIFAENQGNKLFKLDTPNTSYIIGVMCREGFLGHVYYGKRVNDMQGAEHLTRMYEPPFTPDTNARDRLSFMDCFPTEYSSHGVGDYRESSIRVKSESGQEAVLLTYVSHEIYKGKKSLEGLPATFGSEAEVTTLEITCEDKVIGLTAVLSYSVFEDTDAIARNIKLINTGKNELIVNKVMSACLDMDNHDYEMITMHGSWARERHMQRKTIGYGKSSVSSVRGETGHQDQPFMAVLERTATQTSGDVYGMHLAYSGNFRMLAEVSQFDTVRLMCGIEPENFSWVLESGASFQAPEALLVYSAEGLGGMSRSYHELYRKHLIRSPYKDKKRPILINNWEGTYFDFDETKLYNIAKEAAALGVEMLVMDDGWFGNRFDDNRALGDWFVNEEKLKGGLKALVDNVNSLGMEFGIWFEPEMISPDSELYREHPDWAIAIPGRTPGLARNQFVLDVSRKEVRDYILDMMFKVLHSANIKYVKWDMNRPLSDVGSAVLGAKNQGELSHRYVLGMYEMQERLLAEFPDLLLENCSGGGARFDPGMLYYSPQIWTSDDTDAIERLQIQEGTALIYPLSTMGAHVSVCPNHTVGRNTPFDTRGYVALAGTFGYELDMTKLSEEDKQMVKKQTQMYHQFNDIVREGDYYRIASYGENHLYDCFQVVSKDKKKSLVFYVQVLNEANKKSRILKLQGLSADSTYCVKELTMEGEEGASIVKDTGKVFGGELLMNAGLAFERMWGDYRAKIVYLEEV